MVFKLKAEKILPALQVTQPVSQPPKLTKPAPQTPTPKPTPVPLTQTRLRSRKKKPIPKAMREQIWLRDFGKVFEAKCKTTWCQNTINVWDFQAGHDIPESKGGKTEPGNLVPICARCNLSMSDTYTFKEWNAMSGKIPVPIAPLTNSSSWWCC